MKNYKLRDTKFLGHLWLLGLKESGLNKPAANEEEENEDGEKNGRSQF